MWYTHSRESVSLVLIGIVSDTHNNLKNIEKIIELFNKEAVELVIHTGDITNAPSIAKFSNLNCGLVGVFGNNDRHEKGLKEKIDENRFEFDNPPKLITLKDRLVAIFHEPDEIESFIDSRQDIDIVVHGHTHRYRNEFINNVLLFNPGECAGFIKGSNSIATINLDNLEIKRIFF